MPLAVLLLVGLDDIHQRPDEAEHWATILFLGLGALDMGHRLYTFPMAYADRSVFRRHRVRLLVAPLVVAAVLVPVRVLGVSDALTRGLVTAMVLWNLWHVYMQRIGFLRIYAGKLGGALRESRAAWLDRALVWGLLAFTIVLGVVVLGEAARSTGDGRRLVALLGPVVEGRAALAVTAVAVVALGLLWLWLRQEGGVQAPWPERVPRVAFAASTAALVLLPLWSPLIGVACLKFSHAVEYIAFVHVYEAAKFRRLESDRSVLARLMRRPWLAVPLFFLLFCVLFTLADLPAYMVMFVAPLHFLYDGWIWKVRRAEVRAPLSAASA